MTYTDLCPMCGVLREMDISGYRTVSIDAKGNSSITLTRAYHCRACCCFVRCEDVEDTPANREGVILDKEVTPEKPDRPDRIEELQPSHH